MIADLSARLPRGLRPALRALDAANRRLWDLEDRVRAAAGDGEVARLKRRIDRANLERHRRVAVVDAWILRRHPRGAQPGDAGALLSSESIGQMLDRATILARKRALADRPVLVWRWQHVLRCIDQALAALRSGHWVHHPAGEVKLYGAPP